MGLRVALINNKGGVGKTLSALALAEATALRGLRVLVVDIDAQANATRRLRVRPEPGRTLADCLRPGVEPGSAHRFVHRSGWPEYLAIDVLPGDMALEDRVAEASQPGSHYRLRKALAGADDPYHLTVIDCPPSIGHLTMMAIAALNEPGDAVLVPLKPEADDIVGARRAMQTLSVYAADLEVPTLGVAGLIVNNLRSTHLHETRMKEFSELLSEVPTLATIPQRTRVAEALDAGSPLGGDLDLAPILREFDELSRYLVKVSTDQALPTGVQG